MRSTRPSPTAVAIGVTAAFAAVYLIWAPPSGDLAAAVYRVGFFERNGFAPYDAQWYGGYDTLGYSVLLGPLGALLGIRLLAALAAVLAAACFARLVDHPLAAAWFAIGVGVTLGSSRIAFTLGLGLGLAALLAATRRQLPAACALAVATSLASPLAGAFLGLVAVAITGWPGRPPRLHRAALAAAALIPIAALVVAFPAGGFEPFAASSFWPALAATAVVALAAPRLRPGLMLYGAACIASFLIPTPVGGNAVRLAELLAGPLAAAALWPRRRLVLAALALPLAWLAAQPSITDVAAGAGDPATTLAYYRPLERLLAEQPGPPFRIEVPFTREHWEAADLAPHFALARGWERQLDIAHNALFYAPHLTAAAYDAWLRRNAVAYVALPDTQLDYSARQEAALIEAGQKYLRPLARLAHWRVFAVVDALPLASSPATMTRLAADDFQLRFDAPGTSEVRLRYTSYWVADDACVSRAPDGFTDVRAARAGLVDVAARVRLRSLLGGGPACPAR